jgi:hypothetical protein
MKIKIPPRSHLRGLLKFQKGRCALTGVKLDPNNIAADHIIPLSDTTKKDDPNYGKFWLVSAQVNKMKSNLSLDDLYNVANLLMKNKTRADEIKNKIFKSKIEEMDKETFDKYILDNFDEDGLIKD